MYAIFFSKLSVLKNVSSYYDETWASLTISGTYCDAINESYFEELFIESFSIGIDNLLTFSVSNEIISLGDYADELVDGCEWKLHVNKNALHKDVNDVVHTFFYSIEKFKEWAIGVNPISATHPFNNAKYSIEVYGIDEDEKFGGSQFVVSSDGNVSFSENNFDNIENDIVCQCHSFMSNEAIIKPSCHLVAFGGESELAKPFFCASIYIMAYALCNELYDNDKIVVRGVRRLELSFGYGQAILGSLKQYQRELENVIRWVYEKDCSLRHKLFMDRITLDLNLEEPFILGISSIICDALVQAKERYNFATYERQDDYYRELRDLLKDIKGMSDQCNQKIRSILANLSRDVLGALLLIGVTLLSKISELEKLSQNHLVEYVFAGYGIYFLASALLQSIIDSTDLYFTNKEFDYWKNISRNYISNADFFSHKKNTYSKRLSKFIFLYLMIILIYVGLSIICFNAFSIWQQLQVLL